MVKTRKRILPNLLLLVLTLGLTLAAAEWIARRALPLDPYEIVPDDPEAEPIGVEHPTRGHALRPGFRGGFVHPDFAGEEVATNSQGFRDREPPTDKASDALHVTVLGDSVTFGTGVSFEETFSALLESHLAGDLTRPVRVFNTGVPGYGPLHQLVVLREEHARQQPDVATVAFYIGNDLQEIYTFYRQRGMLIELMDHSAVAAETSERPIGRKKWEIDGETRKVITAHADAEIRFPVQQGWTRRGTFLHFGAALLPHGEDQPGADGVRFEVAWEADGQATTLFNEVVDANRDSAPRGWNDRRVNLSMLPLEGATLVLRTTGGATRKYGWAEPHIFYNGASDVLGRVRLPPRLLLAPAVEDYFHRVAPANAGMTSRVYWERRSSFLRFVLGRLDNLAVRWRLKSPRAVFTHQMISTFDREAPESVRTGLDWTMRALSAMRNLMSSRDGRVVLLLIPTKFQTEPETVRRFVEQAGLDPERIDVEQPHRALLDFCARSGITCVDMLPELRQRVASGERVYFPEGHPNRLGHRIIAERLAAAIEETAAGP